MKYLVTAILLFLGGCAPLQNGSGDPYRPASDHFLRVDNNGTEDVTIYLHPHPQRVGRCGSIRVCEIPLSPTQADDIAQGKVQIAYRRLSHRDLVVMPYVTLYRLELTVGRFDSGSWLKPRR